MERVISAASGPLKSSIIKRCSSGLSSMARHTRPALGITGEAGFVGGASDFVVGASEFPLLLVDRDRNLLPLLRASSMAAIV